MKREFLQELRVGEQPLPKQVVDAIMAENGRDIQHHREQAVMWEEKYNQQTAAHAVQLQQMKLQSQLEQAVYKHAGRNVKAIAALLDLEEIGAQSDPQAAMDSAMQALKQAHGYLFAPTAAAPYAAGTGTAQVEPYAVSSLSGALREKFGRK